MAYLKPNQPIIFNEAEDLCSTDTDYFVQIVDNTDKSQFQLALTICNGQSQLFPDPNFSDPPQYTLGSNWAINNNTLCHTSGSTALLYTITQFGETTQYYQVTIIVDSISVGGAFNVFFGSTLVGSFSTVGEHVFYGFPSGGVGARPLIIQPQNATDEVCISSLNSFEILTNFIILVYNLDGTFIDLFEQSSASSYFVFSENTVTITVDWANFSDDPIADGCYYFCLLDPCLNTNGQNYPAQIINGGFTGNADGWTLGSAWTYSSNTVQGTFSGTPVNNYITQSNVFINYSSSYSIDINVTAKTGDIGVYFGTNLVGTINSTGITKITGIPSVNLDLQFRLISGTATIESVSASEITIEDYVCDYRSNTFKLGDYSCACPETLLINGCNDEDGLGFDFTGSGFSPRLRLQAKLKQARYSSERVVEEDSNGTKRVIYFNGRKSKNFVADLLPEYIHDFLRTLAGYDRFYINGVEYFVEDDEYNVVYDDSQDNVGSVSILVSEKTQLIKNINCNSIENSCALPQLGNDCDTPNEENYILQEDNPTQYITLENSELIELES